MKELGKQIKKCITDKKRSKRQEKFKEFLKSSEESRTFPAHSVKKRTLSPNVKNDKGEMITSRNGIPNVVGEFYSKLYADSENHQTR